MRFEPRFNKIKNRLTFWLLLVSIVPLIAGFSIIYFQRVEAIKHEAFNKLTAIRDLKVEQLNRWLLEREGDINTISGDFEVRDLESVVIRSRNPNSTLNLQELNIKIIFLLFVVLI